MELIVIFTREQLESVNGSDIHSIAKLWFATHPQADKFAEGMIANMRMAAFMDTMVGGLNGNHINDEVSAEIDLPDTLILDIKDGQYSSFKFEEEKPMPLFGTCVTIRLMKTEA